MKKLVSIFLALALLLVVSIPAFAANLNITDSGDRDYVGYKLLNLTTSPKTDGEGYNYAYTVNAKYRTILRNEVFAANNAIAATAADVTDTQIIEYLAAQQGDSNGVYNSMRTVADRIYRAIKAANPAITPDATDLTGNNDVVGQGYWMFADVTDLANANEANSLVMVSTMGQEDITINFKRDLPTVEKKVKDINDSEDNNIADNAWVDSADHDYGSVVPFKLTATLPSNVANYEAYKVIFHDTLSSGLALSDTNKANIKVYMYASKAAADADVDLTGTKTDVTASFTVTTANDNGNTNIDITCTDVLDITGVTKDSAFVVYYETTLDTDAVIGAAGTPNEVYLEYSNDPYSTSTGKTAVDVVKVFTYKVIINKTDDSNNPLKGAGFTLSKKNSAGEYVEISEIVGGDLTQFVWNGLDDGDYKLEESTVPAGYNKMTDLEFTISATHSELADEPALTALNGGSLGTGVVDTGAITKAIVNNTGTILPETGAIGTIIFIVCGAVLAAGAAVFMITRKKMSVYED